MLLMNTTIRAAGLVLALLCTASWVSAQKSSVTELLNRADRQFDLYSYNLAIQTYEQVLKEEKSNARALARIGDCHYQLNRPERAIEWYQKAQNTYNMEPDVPLRLGKALMQTTDYDGAKDQFLLYAQTDENIGRHFAKMADYAIKNAKKEAQWQVKNEAINTAQSDFGPAFYQTRVVFNSARTDLTPKNAAAGDAPGGNNYLYVSQRNPESELLQKPSFLRSDVQNNRNEGPVSFSANGRKVAFSRNRFISGTRQIAESGMNMSIYIADVEDGNWKNIKAFPFNGSSYSTGFPCLSPDGNKLIFASTQPGGFGGWDIYVSNLTSNGWSEPRNLGTPLNTPGNEVTPFFDGQDLYFSSDWHPGFGGLDVFRAALGSTEVTEVFHLGPGVNSPRDDYGFIYNSNDNIGYLTSTRSGGRGNEDIWMVSKKWNERDLTTRGSNESLRPSEYSTPADLNYNDQTRDAGSNRRHVLVTDVRGLPLTDVDIDLTDCYGSKGYTDADGKFYFDELLRPIDCKVTVKKRGYRDATIALRDFGKQNVKITLGNDIREEFKGYVFDSKTQAPIRGVAVSVQLSDGPMQVTTDEAGFYSLYLEPALTYLVTYTKYGYTEAVVRTSFSFNSNNRITNVYLDKSNDPTISSTTAKRDDGYVSYDNTARPLEYSNANEPTTRTVYPRETAKTPQVEKFNGYSIQLAAMPEEPSDARLQAYEPLITLANLYVKKEGRMNKIRLGIFRTQSEADENLKTVLKDKAYKGAWVVEERGADESLIIGNENLNPVQHSTLPGAVKGSNAPVRYALQLGSFASGKSFSISDYTRLSGMGNLYSKSEYGYTKVRLGVWGNYEEAERTKAEAVRRGFIDAIIITERADDPEIRDYLLSNGIAPKGENPRPVLESPTPVTHSTTPSAANPFYVRIAALSKPESFDESPMTGLGVIEKRRAENAPGMTVILLGSYPNMETARKVASKLVGMGYADAHVVKDSKGKLIRQ